MLEPRAARRERSSVSARAAACARVRVVRPRGRERAHIFRKRWFSSWRRRRRRVGASGDSSVCSDLKKVASPTAARKSARRRRRARHCAARDRARCAKLFRGDRRRAWVATARRTRRFPAPSARANAAGRMRGWSRPRFPWETPRDPRRTSPRVCGSSRARSCARRTSTPRAPACATLS